MGLVRAPRESEGISNAARQKQAKAKKGGFLMKQGKWIILIAALLCLLCGAALAENQYYAVNAPIEISAAEPVVLTLDAKEGWMWNIGKNQRLYRQRQL